MKKSITNISKEAKMPKKKTVKLTNKVLDTCPHCGRKKLKDESIVTPERMQFINEVVTKLDENNVRLA
jgi:MoaA/NifB/PqqE/SkfB family radical SAM enzyme